MSTVENKGVGGARLGGGRRRRGTVIALLSAAAVVVLVLALALPRLSDRAAPAESETAQNGAAPSDTIKAQKASAGAETPLSPLLIGTGVLHIKGREIGSTPTGEEPFQQTIEFWYDLDTGDALFFRRIDKGHTPWTLYSAYEKGRGYSLSSGRRDIAVIYPENTEESKTLRPLDLMFQEKLHAMNGELTPTDRLKAPTGQVALIDKQWINEPFDKSRPVSFLDTATNLPKRITNRGITKLGLDGEVQYLNGDVRYEWGTIETVKRSSLPEGPFAMESYATVVSYSTPPSWLYPTADPRLTPLPTVAGAVPAFSTPYATPVATPVP